MKRIPDAHKLQVLLPEPLFRDLHILAAARCATLSDVVRQLVEREATSITSRQRLLARTLSLPEHGS
jgi:hypothetical protein